MKNTITKIILVISLLPIMGIANISHASSTYQPAVQKCCHDWPGPEGTL